MTDENQPPLCRQVNQGPAPYALQLGNTINQLEAIDEVLGTALTEQGIDFDKTSTTRMACLLADRVRLLQGQNDTQTRVIRNLEDQLKKGAYGDRAKEMIQANIVLACDNARFETELMAEKERADRLSKRNTELLAENAELRSGVEKNTDQWRGAIDTLLETSNRIKELERQIAQMKTDANRYRDETTELRDMGLRMQGDHARLAAALQKAGVNVIANTQDDGSKEWVVAIKANGFGPLAQDLQQQLAGYKTRFEALNLAVCNVGLTPIWDGGSQRYELLGLEALKDAQGPGDELARLNQAEINRILSELPGVGELGRPLHEGVRGLAEKYLFARECHDAKAAVIRECSKLLVGAGISPDLPLTDQVREAVAELTAARNTHAGRTGAALQTAQTVIDVLLDQLLNAVTNSATAMDRMVRKEGQLISTIKGLGFTVVDLSADGMILEPTGDTPIVNQIKRILAGKD